MKIKEEIEKKNGNNNNQAKVDNIFQVLSFIIIIIIISKTGTRKKNTRENALFLFIFTKEIKFFCAYTQV